MKKFFTLLLFSTIALVGKSQQQAVPVNEPYGKIDKADLEMTSCDFEKDANAEVLINTATLSYDPNLNIDVDYHKRIKIFNDIGKNYANIKLEYFSINGYEYITSLQAQTVNLVDGKVEITKLDKKQAYTQVIDKYTTALVFTMPNVKAGSVIEYKYTWNSRDLSNIPTWLFQQNIPVRYSELNTSIPEYFDFSTQLHSRTPYEKDAKTDGTGNLGTRGFTYRTDIEQRVMVNVPSLPDEPFMSSAADNFQRISFVLVSVTLPGGYFQNYNNNWKKVQQNLLENTDFGGQLNRKLNGEALIIDKAKAMHTDDEKIAYIFNEVKNSMKWDGGDEWYTDDGTVKAWDKKSGNSTEINLILYRLLSKSGISAVPMLVSTREHGKVNPAYIYLYQFNRTVVYVPLDSAKYYVLDASDKYNLYNETPYRLLNSAGFYLDMDNGLCKLTYLDKRNPVLRSVFIDAKIKPDGKMEGTATISGASYNRINTVSRYKTDGEEKYVDYLRDNDNNLKVSSIKMENMDVDTLPLVQDINFNLDLAGSDDTYIYFNPNIFTSLHKNPFLSEARNTDIDFGFLDDLAINGIYKIPDGYKVEALPKTVILTTPDKNIIFRRVVSTADGSIAVRYTLSYRRSIYPKENYPDFHEFYKQMYQMLNEQIVLKKS